MAAWRNGKPAFCLREGPLKGRRDRKLTTPGEQQSVFWLPHLVPRLREQIIQSVVLLYTLRNNALLRAAPGDDIPPQSRGSVLDPSHQHGPGMIPTDRVWIGSGVVVTDTDRLRYGIHDVRAVS